jgi:DNA primase
MGIVAEDIARVRAATDLVAVAGEHMALKRVGRRWQGLCPFHAERTPSFSINPEQGLYHCFGCGVGGDAITFLREIEHLEFAEAVERLAARAGIHLRYEEAAEASAERLRLARLKDVVARAVEWYHGRLLSAPDAAAARGYLRARGYDGDVVRTYRLGWAPDEWDALARSLRLPDDVLRDTGLGFVNRAGRQQDGFRARVLFPIFDQRGDPVAFGGRALPGGAGPKYKNSPETPLYRKSRVLYGLNWAKAAVVAVQEVVLCEGYTDVIGLHQAGVPQAVATCGTALAEDHLRLIRNFARRLVLAYDADAAGQAAADRVYEWERRFEVDVAVAAFPAGEDPADLARRDPEALRAAVASARPFLAFRLERALAAADLRTPEGRARAAQSALAAIAEHPDDLVRDQYLMQVADRTGLDPDRLRARLARGGRRSPDPGDGSGPRPAGSAPASPAPVSGPELEALRVAVHRPEEMAARLDEVLFADPVALAAYRALAGAPTLHDAIAGAAGGGEPAAGALLQRLAVEDDDGADAADVAARLAETAARRALVRLDAEARRSSDPGAYAPITRWLKWSVEELRDPGTAVEATGRLVRWLADRSGDDPR